MARAGDGGTGSGQPFFARLAEDLCDFARHEFRLSERGADGKTLRETLEAAARLSLTRRRPPELDGPDCPLELEELWGWFLRLHGTRAAGLGGAGPITEQEIGWFFRNRRIEPEPWQVELIARLDLMAMQPALPGGGDSEI